jgi:hypothetical protein
MASPIREWDRTESGPFIVENPGKSAGRLLIHPLERDRVRVESGWVNNVDDGTEGLTLNGVLYGVTGFVWLRDGVWTDIRPSETRWPSSDLMLSRRDGTYKDASRAAAEKASEVVCATVQLWALEHGDALEAAELSWRNNQAYIAEGQLAEARKYVAELEGIVAALDAGEKVSPYGAWELRKR